MSATTPSAPADPTTRLRPRPAGEELLEADARQRARQLIIQLQVVLKTATTHDRTNVIFLGAIEELRQVMREMLADRSLRLEVVLDDFIVDRHKVRVDLSCYHSFRYVRQVFERLGVGGLVLNDVPSKERLATIALLMARTESPPDEDAVDHLNQALQAKGVEELAFLSPRGHVDEHGDAQDRRRRALRAYEDALTFMKETMTSFVSGELVDVRRGKRLVQDLVDASDERRSGLALPGLAAVKNFHPYTFNHIVNVCVLAIAFGQRLGLDRRQLCQLGMGALFHDIGKLSIPSEVLDKEDPLTPEEWKLIQQHPLYATRHLLTLGNLTEAGMNRLLVALEHHMAYDLKGYPKFRTRDRIHVYSRIVAIVDAYDAMVSKRCYQRQMLPTEALAILLKMGGSRFDPLLVKAFIHCMGIYPIGSLVRLSTHELAVVTSVGDAPDATDRPVIRLVRDAEGRDLGGESVNLRDPAERRRNIVCCLDPAEHDVNVARYTLWEEQDA